MSDTDISVTDIRCQKFLSRWGDRTEILMGLLYRLSMRRNRFPALEGRVADDTPRVVLRNRLALTEIAC